MQRLLTVLLLVCTGAAAQAQWLGVPTPGIPRTADGKPDLTAPVPRTAAGKPDLTGLWLPDSATGSVFGTEGIQPWAVELMQARADQYFEEDPRFRCLPSGPGVLALGGPIAGYRRIVQNPAIVAILHADMSYRQIFLDGRELEANPLPTWMGYSVGRWEGDTLVVDSNGYNDKTWVHRDGLAHSTRLRMTERYTRTDFGHIRIDVTFTDPETFAVPLNAVINMRFRADDEMLETVCNEAAEYERGWGGTISGNEDDAVVVDPAMLAAYAGTYDGIWLGAPTTLEFTVEDEQLLLLRTPPYAVAEFTGTARFELTAQSDNAFVCTCGLGYVFVRNDAGEISAALEHHVSGSWTFTRQP